MYYVSVGLITNSINPAHAVPLEFAAVLPGKETFHCFFHQEYVKIRPGETARIIEWEKRSWGKERLSAVGFQRKFLDFLEEHAYPTNIFTLAGKHMHLTTFPIVHSLLSETVRWSFTHFDPCALLAAKEDEFVSSWTQACMAYDVSVPQDALSEAFLVQQMVKDHLL